MTSRLALAVVLLLPLACADPPAETPQSDDKQDKAEAKPSEAAEPADPNALSPEELALIEADPKTLTPEQNRKRGYALRKKVMQNPDSAAAKALEEARQAALAGQVDVPGEDGKPKDNGVVIPLPEHLRNQDQSYGKPANEPANESANESAK